MPGSAPRPILREINKKLDEDLERKMTEKCVKKNMKLLEGSGKNKITSR